MHRYSTGKPSRRAWRAFSSRDGRIIENQLRDGAAPCCPWCGAILETRLGSRIARSLALGASAMDLDCRGCRRFWCVVRHSARSLRLARMRRLAAAVRAVEVSPPAPSREDVPAPTATA